MELVDKAKIVIEFTNRWFNDEDHAEYASTA